jgi:amino acid adenylation domain-containing protein
MTDVFDREQIALQPAPDRFDEPEMVLLPDPASRHEPFPLNDVQRAYWLGRNGYFELGNVACHVYFEFDVSGIDRGRLGAAWQRLIDRHEMLRAVVRPDGTQQVLAHTPHYEIKHQGLRAVDENEARSRFLALRDRMSHQIFAPDRWPLFELRTTELAGQVILHFSLDLLFVDLWSLQLLFDEWTQLALDSDTYLAPLEISFRDYVLAATKQRESANYRRAEAYWLQRVATLPPAPRLPLAKALHAVVKPVFVRRHTSLAAESWRKLKARGTKARLTPSGLLMAAFARVLAEWSETRQFTINTTVFQRAPLHPHVYRVVGDFTSIVLVEANVESAESFEKLARRIAEQFRSDLEYREYGGLQVLQELAKRGDPDRPPIMPVVFTSALAQSMPGWRSADTVGELTYGITQTPQVYLDHQVYERNGVLHLTWDVVEELFPPGLLDEMFAAYTSYLQRLADEDAAWTEANPCFAPAQRGLGAPAAAAGVAPSVLSGAKVSRYSRIDAESDGAANADEITTALRRHPLVADALVVRDANGRALAAYVTAKKSGELSDPAPTAWQASDLSASWMRRGTGVAASELGAFLQDVEALERQSTDAMVEALSALGVFKTAGDTRTAVDIIRDCGLRSEYRPLLARWLHLLTEDGLLASRDSLHYTCAEPLRPTVAPLASHRPERNPLAAYFQEVRRNLPALLRGERDPLELLFPGGDWTIAEALYQQNPLFRSAYLQAGAVVQALAARLQRPIRVLEVGSGVGSLTSFLLPALPADRTSYLFTDISRFFQAGAKRKFAGYQFVKYGVLDALRDPLAQGLLPESFDLVAASAVMHNAPDPAAALTQLRPVLVPGGAILLVEATRNTRAHAVTIGFIEGLNSLSGAQDRPFLPLRGWIEALEAAGFDSVAASGDQADAQSDFGLDLIVARAPELTTSERRLVLDNLKGDLSGAVLRDYLAWQLPAEVVPHDILVVEALPSTTDANTSLGSRSAGQPGTGISTATESILHGIWCTALGREAIGIDDNFLALGGDSLIAVRIVAAIRERFHVDLRAQVMFAAPTVRQMAVEIESRLRQGSSSTAHVPALPRVVPDPDNAAEPFPLTEIQQTYWIGRSSALELGNVGAHFYLELDAQTIDHDRFQHAWQTLIARHGMLRTAILSDGRQKLIEPPPRYRIELTDLATASEQEAESALARERARMSHKVYSGEHWPYFEIRMTRIAPDRTRIHLSFDLLMIDLWSLRLLMRELLVIYADPSAELPPLTLSFRDYVLGLAALEKSEGSQRSLQYWIERLPTLPPAPDLPLACAPASIRQPHFARRAATLEAGAWERIKSWAQARQLTASSVLLAAFSEVLGAWSRRKQFTVNLTLFQRLPFHEQVNQIVGDFTSTTLLAIDTEQAQTFLVHAQNVQDQLWRDLDHSYVSGVRVIRELARSREFGLRPSMPVVFTSGLAQGMPELERLEQLQGPGFGEVAYSISQTPQVWLDHQVYEQGGCLHFNWDAVEELFPPGLLDEMFAAYRGILQRLGQDDAAWMGPKADLLPRAAPSGQLPSHEPVAEQTRGWLHAGFLEQAARRPHAAAVVTIARRLTYQDVHLRARHLARQLRRLGARPNKLVAVVMEKGWEQVIATIGILEAGAAYLPIDPELPPERRALLLRRGEVDIVVTQPCVQERLSWPVEVRCVLVDWDMGGQETEEDWQPPPCTAEDLAYVIFTSGSTGEPKGVMIEHRSALNTILDINERFGVGPDDRVLALSSLSFDLSVYDIFGALAAGATIVLPHPSSARDPDDWAALVRHERITVWNSVPALLEMLVDHVGTRKELLGDTLRLALLSGDWIPVKLPDRSRALLPGLQVISLGGATEAAIWSIFYPIGTVGEDWTSIPYGRALRHQQMYVLNEAMQPTPTWVAGEIHIGGAGLARGYWRDETRTNAQFVRHPQTGERLYRTGDHGRYLPSGDIEFLGREDDQVKIQGFRIELGEIEAALTRHPNVKAAVVATVGERAGPKHLAAYVVVDGVSPDALENYLREKLPSYMVPSVWQTLHQLPLTANGKVNRKALPLSGATARAPSADPTLVDSNALARVATLIGEELGQAPPEPDRNLLTLGATSMDLVRIVARLDKEFGVRPSFQEFFREPTSASLARLIERRTGTAMRAAEASAPRRRGLDLIIDPQAREAFRREGRGVRTFSDNAGRLPLGSEELAEIEGRFLRRRAIRGFLPEPVPLGVLGRWLAELRQLPVGEAVKHAYGSAGGCYPVQTYLHAKQDGVAGCPAGTYYYHPVDHSLVPLTLGAELDPAIHEPFTNRPIFERARFSLFLVHQPAAIEPVYGDLAWRFSVLEAGAMAQVLESSAWRFGLGVCPIGWVDLGAIRPLLQLDETQELLHAHVGGLVPASSYSRDFEEGTI